MCEFSQFETICIADEIFLVFLSDNLSQFQRLIHHHENCKKVEVQYRFCACAVGVSTDSVFPSIVAHRGGVVKCRLCRSVAEEFGTIGALVPSSRISGVGHSGSWPPLHCGDSKHPAPEAAPGAPLHSEALSPECRREHQETGEG